MYTEEDLLNRRQQTFPAQQTADLGKEAEKVTQDSGIQQTDVLGKGANKVTPDSWEITYTRTLT